MVVHQGGDPDDRGVLLVEDLVRRDSAIRFFLSSPESLVLW